MMRCRILILIVAAALLAAVLGQAAFAGAQSYVDRPRMIKAGVLVPEGASGIATPMASYIFFIMGQREDLKPHGWAFENPLAGGNDAFKSTPAYWEVPLNQTTLENLSKFDVLYLCTSQPVRFKMGDREKLRRYVDGGGCLWVDNAGGMTFPTAATGPSPEGFFLSGVNFILGAVSGVSNPVQKLHPLLTNPFWLSSDDINKLGYAGSSINPGFAGDLSTPPSPTALVPVVVNQDTTSGTTAITTAALEYGSGRVVFTSGFIGGKMIDPASGWLASMPGNSGTGYVGDNSALKFAYNVVAFSASYTTFRKDYRRTGSSCDGLEAPLIYSWKYDKAPLVAAGNPNFLYESSPVIWKNVAFFSSGDTLYALDMKPENDLDGDGNPDDGLVDAPDSEYDVVAMHEFPGNISAPTVATMLDPATSTGGKLGHNDFVFVNCADGNVYAVEAFPKVAGSNGQMVLGSVLTPLADMWCKDFKMSSNASDSNLLPVVVQNGWIYATGSDGVLYAYSPVLEKLQGGSLTVPKSSWSIPLWTPDSNGKIPAIVRYGPTMAFIKNQNTGAITQVISYLGRFFIDPNNPQASNDRIFSVPIYVSGDRLKLLDPIATAGTGPYVYQTSYPNYKIASYPYPEAWAVDQTYDPSNPSGREFPVTVTTNGNPGQVQISCTGHVIGPNTVVYMAYAIDYSDTIPSIPNYELQPRIGQAGSSSFDIKTTATPSIGPDDRFYFGVEWNPNNMTNLGTGKSSVFCQWFDGNTGSAKLEWSYFLHGGGTIQDPTAGIGASKGTLESIGMTQTGQLWGVHARVQTPGDDPTYYPVANLEVRSTPAVSGDRVFVTATTANPGGEDGPRNLSGGYLLCFKARPSFQIRLNRPLIDYQNNGSRMSVRIWQPDLLFDPASAPPAYNAAFPVPSNMIDYNNGTITVSDFTKARLQGWLPSVQTGMFTPSLPVWVWVNNQLVPLKDIDFSSWDNLLWALPLPDHNGKACTGCTSSPVILGDYVYFTDNDGYMYAVSVNATAKDPALKVLDPQDEDAKSWMPMADPIGGGGTPYSTSISVAANNGTMLVPSSTGLYAFTNDKTLVTDNRRVMEVGSDGRISWSCDAVYVPTIIVDGNPTPKFDIGNTNLSRPVMAQKLGSSDYLVVDSGNDRVLRIERSGEVTWALKDFTDERGLLRSGEPKTLSAPSDALMWEEYEKLDGDWYYVKHCLVVDTGNFRILDVVDRYYCNKNFEIVGVPQYHVLNWVSHTSYVNKSFTFNSEQFVRTAQYGDEIWASISNYGLGTVDDPNLSESSGGGQLGGAIIAMTYRKRNADGSYEYYAKNDAERGKVNVQITTLTDSAGKQISLAGPRHFQVLDPIAQRLLICDSSAVYMTQKATDSNGKIINKILAALTDAQYQVLPRTVTNEENNARIPAKVRIPFQPQRAQWLPSNKHILITNGFAGRIYDREKSKFTGEILEMDDQLNMLHWYGPQIRWVPDVAGKIPVLDNEEGYFKQELINAPNLDQPTCAQRLF